MKLAAIEIVEDRTAESRCDEGFLRVERLVKDPRYQKYVRRYSKFMAHDEENSCSVGDRVRIIEHRPISKLKRWKVQSTIQGAAGV